MLGCAPRVVPNPPNGLLPPKFKVVFCPRVRPPPLVPNDMFVFPNSPVVPTAALLLNMLVVVGAPNKFVGAAVLFPNIVEPPERAVPKLAMGCWAPKPKLFGTAPAGLFRVF